MLERTIEENVSPSQEKIIWTPRFILLFVLTLVLGLSIAGQLALAWTNHLFFPNRWTLHGLVVVVGLGWLALGIVTRSLRIRAGCLFGLIWAGFMTLNIYISSRQIGIDTPLQSYLDAAICVALLGAYLGLSSQGTLRSRWDLWLFLLIPFLAAAYVGFMYLRTHNLLLLEQNVTRAALVAALLIWWARLSCWKVQPGPTLLFGLVPMILLLGAYFNRSSKNLFLLQVSSFRLSASANSNNFFFAQVILLCLLLGCMRAIKSEIAN